MTSLGDKRLLGIGTVTSKSGEGYDQKLGRLRAKVETVTKRFWRDYEPVSLNDVAQ